MVRHALARPWKDADPDIPVYKQAKAEYATLQSGVPFHQPPILSRRSDFFDPYIDIKIA
jgi:hypothetical protein